MTEYLQWNNCLYRRVTPPDLQVNKIYYGISGQRKGKIINVARLPFKHMITAIDNYGDSLTITYQINDPDKPSFPGLNPSPPMKLYLHSPYNDNKAYYYSLECEPVGQEPIGDPAGGGAAAGAGGGQNLAEDPRVINENQKNKKKSTGGKRRTNRRRRRSTRRRHH